MAFDFYFAGGQSPEADNLIYELNANRLLSYVNDRKLIESFWFNKKKQGWKGKLMIDSGAFTAHRKDLLLSIDDYCNWINANYELFDYAIELDDIPGKWGQIKTAEQIKQSPINSWNNYLYMLSKVNCPDKILPVFHQGENFKYLEQMVNHQINGHYIKYICISGNKELTGKQREAWYEKVFTIIKSSNNANVKTHCLGSATLSNIEMFPFTSMDATSWIMTGSNGSIMTDYGIVFVSNNNLGDPNHINNMPEQAQEKIRQYCNKYNIKLSDCSDNYKFRSLINIHYLFDKSKVVSFNTNIKFRKKGLF